ncbi:MAG: ribonuclease P protein component [Helcococcus sp.]|nr:ribonuclease P protein component [Helcococcus sp.]
MEAQNRIKKNQEFNRLYKRSKRFYNRDFRVLVADGGRKYPRFGFTVTRKYGKANKRNKIRRRLKEIIRLNIDIFENKDYIIAPNFQTIDMDYKDLEQSLKHVIAISKRHIDE